MISFFHAVFFRPLYNGFIFLMDILPWLDAGVIVVIFTVLVKIIVYALSRRAAISAFNTNWAYSFRRI